MAAYKLVIGNKNYSSWSLRGWLALREAGIAFEEIRVPLRLEDTPQVIRKHSPSGKVPALLDAQGKLIAWESLAIGEWAAEQAADRQLWPQDPTARAFARAAASEMHAGFPNLRNQLPMDIRLSLPGHRYLAEAQTDINRILALWGECRGRFGQGGPFLFGRFGVVDAMYAPVASRFRTYGIRLTTEAEGYVQAIHDLPSMREWCAAARAEVEVINYLAP
jgi:glutathione S-transferase